MVEQTTQVCPPIKKLSKKLKKVNTFEKAFSKEKRERERERGRRKSSSSNAEKQREKKKKVELERLDL